MKLVYPAPGRAAVEAGIAVLRGWLVGGLGLSLTPTGSRQARVLAALYGSRLVYAPLRPTAERMSAHWYRDLLAAGHPEEAPWLT